MTAAVLPTGPAAVETTDPHALVASGQGVVVSWKRGGNTSDTWGPALSATSSLARSLTEIAQRAGAARVLDTAALFRVEVPAGQTLLDLVPAVGGGFRGMIRSGSKITSHARLVPVGGAAVGGGAALALGPLVGLMALSVGAEMLARHQQEQQIKAIPQVAEALLKRQKQQDTAVLTTSEDTIRAANGALLDRIRVPESVGLGATANNLHNLRNRAVGWLESWEGGVRSDPWTEKGLDIKKMHSILGAPLDSPGDFEASVGLLVRSVILDSRMRIIGAVEAATLNPEADLSQFRGEVEADLRRNADVLERLRETLHDLSDYPIHVGYPHRLKTESEARLLASRLSRAAHAVGKTASALPLLDEQNRLVIEAQRQQDGTWAIRKPLAA